MNLYTDEYGTPTKTILRKRDQAEDEVKNENVETVKEVIAVPIDLIDVDDNSRVNYDEVQMSELMVSMKQFGLLQPVGVVKRKTGRYALIFGNRRFQAAKKLGWSTIEATPQNEIKSPGAEMLQNAIENMQRENVTLTEQGRIFDNLVKEHGLTASEIAAKVGISKTKVDYCLESYRYFTEKERAMIGSGGVGTAKKGKVKPFAAIKVLNIAKNLSLSADQRSELMEYAKQDRASIQKLNLVGKLMKTGLSLKDAVKKTDTTRGVALRLLFDGKKLSKIEERTRKSVYQLAEEALIAAGLPLVKTRQKKHNKAK